MRRRLEVEDVAADPKDAECPWVALGELVDDDPVLCEHDVALDWKLANLVDDIDSPLSRMVGEGPGSGE